MKEELLHADITEDIIKAFYQVYNTLGYGFLEKVYENALVIVLRKLRHTVLQQHPISVYFEGQLIGEYFTDLLIDDRVIIELKTTTSLDQAHEAQLVNYLKATKIEVGMLLNFGKKPEFKRKLFTNNLK